MLDLGILDPIKVTRLALQNDASVVSLLLTTEVIIAEHRRMKVTTLICRAAAWVMWECSLERSRRNARRKVTKTLPRENEAGFSFGLPLTVAFCS